MKSIEALVKNRLEARRSEESLDENTLYSSPQERADLLADDQKLADAFVFSFLGILGAYVGATDQKQLQPYFTKERSLRPGNISDDNNDTSIILKLLSEKKIIRTSDVLNQMTKFLVKMKMGQIKSIDETYIRDWLNMMKAGFFIQNLSPETLKIYKTYTNDPTENLERLAYRLFRIRNKFKSVAGEFTTLAMKAKFKKIAELDAENDGTTPTSQVVVAAPSPGIAPPIADPVQPNFPFTPDWIYTTVTGQPAAGISANQMRDLPKEAIISLKALFEKYMIVDEQTIKDAFESNKIPYNSTTKKQLFDNISSAMRLMKEAELKTFFQQCYYESVNAVSVPKELFGVFKRFEPLLEKWRYEFRVLHYQDNKFKKTIFTDYYIELNDRQINKIETFDDLRLFFSGIKKISPEFPIFSSSRILSNLFLRTILPRASGGVDISAITYEWRKLVYVFDKFIQKFDPDPSALKDFERNLEKNATQENKFVELFKKSIPRYTMLWGNSPNEFEKIMNDICFRIYSKQIDSIIDSELLVQQSRTGPIKGINYNKILQIDPQLVGKGFIDRVVDKIKGDPEFEIDDRKGVMFLKHNQYRVGEAGALKIDDANAEMDWYQKTFQKLGITENKDKIDVFSKTFLQKLDTFPVGPLDNRNEFYLKVLIEMDRLGVSDQIGSVSESMFFKIGTNRRDTFSFFSQLPKQQTLEIVKSAINTPNSIFKKMFSKDAFTGMKREEKAEAVEFFASIFLDHAESNPDLIDKFYEMLDPYQQNKVREKMTSFEILEDSFDTGTISFQEKLSSARIKEILSYNNIDPASFILDKLPRKSKFDTFSSYNKKIKDAISAQGAKVPEPLVTEENLTQEEIATRNHSHIIKNYAGKHGNVYPIFKRAFSVSLPTKQYEEFTKRMADAGIHNENIIPAFHGTGGIGASFILRFGFRVISDTKLIVGRMLGDGVYFSNKIDKACQYVGNTGLTRKRGTIGYIFEMESQLGENNKNYRAAGLGTDQIRSPEWCVFEPNHQLKIMTAYEVELGTYDDFTSKVKSKSVLSEGAMRFSEFLLLEKSNEAPEEQMSFIFFDNRVILDDRQMYYADEIESYGNDVVIERTQDGTRVTFLYTKTTESYDISFATKIKPAVLKKYFTLLNSRKRTSGLRLKKKKKKKNKSQ